MTDSKTSNIYFMECGACGERIITSSLTAGCAYCDAGTEDMNVSKQSAFEIISNFLEGAASE